MSILFSLVLITALLLLMPIGFLAWLIWGNPSSRFELLLRTVAVGAFFLWLFIIGRWDVVGIWWRYVFLAAFVIVGARAWAKSWNMPLLPKLSFRSGLSCLGQAFPTAFFLLILFQLEGYASYGGQALRLTSPLRDSTWYVTHGGSVKAVNHHHDVPAQTYAIDISALNRFGIRANGLLPARLQDYAIYGANVYSPCEGEVLMTESGRPDMAPPDMDRDHIAGNYVVLDCDNATVLLGHLLPGSVKVTPGQVVSAGTAIAKVGNSGRSSEPHLHIHAVRGKVTDLDDLIATAPAAPILFHDRFLVRNASNTHLGNLDAFLTGR